MSISYLVDDLISENNTLITSPSGNGTTVLTLCIANYLVAKGKTIIYFNPSKDIDSEYIKKNFPSVFCEVFFLKSSLQHLINFLAHIDFKIDYLIIDPGDNLMVNKGIIPVLKDLLKNSKLVITSQIRQDPTQGGKLYSPIEELNKRYNNSIFKYSIWIRDVTESSSTFKSRYVDVFDNVRKGNNFIRRYIVKFDKKTGVLIE